MKHFNAPLFVLLALASGACNGKNSITPPQPPSLNGDTNLPTQDGLATVPMPAPLEPNPPIGTGEPKTAPRECLMPAEPNTPLAKVARITFIEDFTLRSDGREPLSSTTQIATLLDGHSLEGAFTQISLLTPPSEGDTYLGDYKIAILIHPWVMEFAADTSRRGRLGEYCEARYNPLAPPAANSYPQRTPLRRAIEEQRQRVSPLYLAGETIDLEFAPTAQTQAHTNERGPHLTTLRLNLNGLAPDQLTLRLSRPGAVRSIQCRNKEHDATVEDLLNAFGSRTVNVLRKGHGRECLPEMR